MILKEELKKLNPHNKEKLNHKLDDVDNIWLKSYILELLELQREETIREVEERLPKMKMEAYEDAGKEFALIGFNDCISEVKTILNKLKK